MIDFDAMTVGEVKELPHPSTWEGANRKEYTRAADCTAKTNKIFEFETIRNEGGVITGFTVTRRA